MQNQWLHHQAKLALAFFIIERTNNFLAKPASVKVFSFVDKPCKHSQLWCVLLGRLLHVLYITHVSATHVLEVYELHV